MLTKQSGVAWVAAALLVFIFGAFVPNSAQAQAIRGAEMFIPQIVADGVVATPQPAIATGERVYGLLGQLTAVTNETYSTRLTTPDGVAYGLVGQDPDVEEQIVTLAHTADVEAVKVWGEVVPAQGGDLPLIAVSGIMPTEVTSPVGGASDAVAVVKFNLVNLYAGPGNNYPQVGQVTQNQACNITGRNRFAYAGGN